MQLYGSSFSPFVRKVLAYAAERGIELEIVQVKPGDTNPAFREASPFGKMPALRDGDFLVADSSAVIAYLEAKFPEGGLIPASPESRARTIWYEEYADTLLAQGVFAMFFNRIVAPKFMKQPGDENIAAAFERDQLPPLIDYLESVVPKSGFLVDDRLTLADLAVASMFVNFDHAGAPLDQTRWPKALAYVAAILARPSFATMVAQEKAILARLG